MKKLVSIAAVTAAVLSMLLAGLAGPAGPAPASAHDSEACQVRAENKKGTKESRACVSPNHKVVTVCDGHKDGHRVEAWVWTPAGPTAYTDESGSKPGCSDFKLPRPAHKLALCVNREGCTNYVNV